MVIIAFGLLGMAGLQMRMQTSEMESYQRSQALLLLNDMANRIAANRNNAASYWLARGQPTRGQRLPDNHDHDRAADLRRMVRRPAGRRPKTAGGSQGRRHDRRARLRRKRQGGDYLITVAWQGLTPISAPPASVTLRRSTTTMATGSHVRQRPVPARGDHPGSDRDRYEDQPACLRQARLHPGGADDLDGAGPVYRAGADHSAHQHQSQQQRAEQDQPAHRERAFRAAAAARRTCRMRASGRACADVRQPDATRPSPTDVPTAVPDPCLAFASWDDAHKYNLVGIAVQAHGLAVAGAVADARRFAAAWSQSAAEHRRAGGPPCRDRAPRASGTERLLRHRAAVQSPHVYIQRVALQRTDSSLSCPGQRPSIFSLQAGNCDADPGAHPAAFSSSIYYVRNYAATAGDGIPTLVRARFGVQRHNAQVTRPNSGRPGPG